jgi:hypothetical protein
MPNPTGSDLHVNRPLTAVSVRYATNAGKYIADKVFPTVPVDQRSDLFTKWSKSDWLRSHAQKRAPGTESPGAGWTITRDSFYCDVYAVHKDIDDQDRANADPEFKLDSDATEFVTQQLLLQRDIDFVDQYLKVGVWETNLVGGVDFTQWNEAGSDPIGDVAWWYLQFERLTGMAPSFMVLGADVRLALKQHPDIIDRIKYTQRGVVTDQLLASLFDTPKLMTSMARKSSGPHIPDATAQDAAASYDFVAPTNSVFFGYAPENPSRQKPSAGYTFSWNGYLGGNSLGLRVKKFRMEHIESDRIEGSQTYDMKVVSRDCGVFVSDVIRW